MFLQKVLAIRHDTNVQNFIYLNACLPAEVLLQVYPEFIEGHTSTFSNFTGKSEIRNLKFKIEYVFT